MKDLLRTVLRGSGTPGKIHARVLRLSTRLPGTLFPGTDLGLIYDRESSLTRIPPGICEELVLLLLTSWPRLCLRHCFATRTCLRKCALKFRLGHLEED